MKRNFLYLIVLIAVVLSGCSVNKPVNSQAPTAVQTEQIDLGSLYFFALGNIYYFMNDFASANFMFRKALEYYPDNQVIRRQIYYTALNLHATGALTTEACSAQIDSTYLLIPFDEDMYKRAFYFYYNTGNQNKAEAYLNLYQKNYDSVSGQIFRIMYDYVFMKKLDPSALEKAYQKAGNDVEALRFIANVYLSINDSHAQNVLWDLHRLAPTVQNDSLLCRYLLNYNEDDSLNILIQSYRETNRSDHLLQLLIMANQAGRGDLILKHKDYLMHSDDSAYLQNLAIAAFIADDYTTINELESYLYSNNPTLLSDNDNEEDVSLAHDSKLNAVFTLNHLITETYDQIHNRLKYINSVDDLEGLSYYIFLWQARKQHADFMTADREKILAYADTLDTIIADYNPAEVKDYVVHYLRFLCMDLADETTPAKRYQCSLALYQNGSRTYDVVYNVLEYYGINKMDSLRTVALEEAVNLFPESALFLNDLGYTYLVRGNKIDEAGVLIKRAINIERDNPYYLDSMAWYYYLDHDYQRALKYIKVPMDMETMPNEIAYHIGMILIENNDAGKAIDYFKKILSNQTDTLYQFEAQEMIDKLNKN